MDYQQELVKLIKNKYVVNYRNGHEDISRPSGYFSTINEAFEAYKEYKENVIKQVAQKEFDDGNITSGCYEAMMKYNVETTDQFFLILLLMLYAIVLYFNK